MASGQWYLKQSQRTRQQLSFPSVCAPQRIPMQQQSKIRHFLFSLALVVVLVNKLVLLMASPADSLHLLWIPSVFFMDVLFLFVLYHGLYSKFLILFVMSTIVALFTTTITSLQVTALLGHAKQVPWTMTVWVLAEWHHFGMLYKAKAAESKLKVWMVVLVECMLAYTIVWWRFRRKQSQRNNNKSLPRTSAATAPKSLQMTQRQQVLFSILYMLLSFSFRPSIPYSKLSQTPCISVPIEVYKGFKDYQRHKRLTTYSQNKKRKPTKLYHNSNNTSVPHPLNVVVIFLESVRADIMPLDTRTPWAKQYVLPEINATDISPFYSKLTQQENSTLHIPLIKSASGLTHKSLLSTLCSMMSLPIQGTTEPFSNFYHACLPQLLQQYGNYTSGFFQPQTESFEHQSDLLEKIGFDTFFGQESFNNMYNPSDDFRNMHTANYFGYEDNVMLPVLGDWMDNSTEHPFLLSYLCGITHDPHTIPPLISWNSRQFSSNKRVNDYLNTVAYMDKWLEKFFDMVRSKGLMESTLFIIMGDHGVNLFNHGSDFGSFDAKYEEGTDVGISIFSESARWKRLLRDARPRHVENGDYTSLDVVPTILQVLGIGDDQVLSGRYNNSWVDGQSLLHPSGTRLRVTIPNPGYTMVLRDGSNLLMQRQSDTPEAFDLKEDPYQMNPLYIDEAGAMPEKGREELAKWGERAVQFLSHLEWDLHSSYGQGERCHNCTLSFLLSNDTLDNWNPEHLAPRRSWFDGPEDDVIFWDGGDEELDYHDEDASDLTNEW